MPGSNSRPNVSEGYEVPLSYRGDRPIVITMTNMSVVVMILSDRCRVGPIGINYYNCSTNSIIAVVVIIMSDRCRGSPIGICMVITYSRVWINRVRLPVLQV